MALSPEQVLALAPDSSAAAAGRKLAAQSSWQSLGQSEVALWGECQGSGLYQVRVALADLIAKCSCPSRKFPCKHALGLLLLATQEPGLPRAEAPAWVQEWLEQRAAAAAKKQTREARKDTPADPEAQGRRAEQREARVLAGLELLDLWLADLVRHGLAGLEERPRAHFEQMAGRLVDHQAPGLARRVRALAGKVGSGADWPARVLEEAGLLALLSASWRRRDALAPGLRADLRQAVGYTIEREEILADGATVDDQWFAFAQEAIEEDRVRAQRTWLRGLRSGRLALLIQFAAGRTSFPELLVPGSTLDATLSFYPGAAPLRALLHTRRAVQSSLPAPVPGHDRLAGALEEFAATLALNPWQDRVGALLTSVTPVPSRDGVVVRDQDGSSFPLAGVDHWMLLALSGGHPLDLCGEWDGRCFLPLAAIHAGRYHGLREPA